MPPMPMRPAAPKTAGYDAAMIAALGETGLPGAKEVLDYSFFDTKTFTTVTAASKQYFAQPGTDPLTSNFQGSGAFPQGQAFLVRTLRLVPTIGTQVTDIINMMKYLSLTFTLENAKKYAEGPAWMFPAGVGMTAEFMQGTAVPAAAPANSASYGNPGIASLGNVYRFQKPVVLRPQQPFAITVTSTASFTAVVTPMGLSVVMDGVFVRNVI